MDVCIARIFEEEKEGSHGQKNQRLPKTRAKDLNDPKRRPEGKKWVVRSGIEPATSPSPVGRINHWATPAGRRSRSHAPPRRKDYFPRGGEGHAGGEAPLGAGCMAGGAPPNMPRPGAAPPSARRAPSWRSPLYPP